MSGTRLRYLLAFVLFLPAADSVAEELEILRFEGGVQTSSGSIPNCCSSHSLTAHNGEQLGMVGCTTMGGYCMTSRKAPLLTFDLSVIPEGAVVESVRLRGSRVTPRSGSGGASVAFLPYGQLGTATFNVFNGQNVSFAWTPLPAFAITLDPDWFNEPGRDRFAVVRLTTSGDASSAVRNGRGLAPWLEITLAEPPCPADLTGNRRVDAGDLGFLMAAWGEDSGHAADLDGSGLVDAGDLGMMLQAWGECPGG
ncbi:MAG: hypothetical protein VX726_04150 [Planctomycetota bacterium]|nr:hypothetical protein [Planctomycetota bacterium]MEE2894915.1 hypothetical protein [Planctomycetota bacterium]